MLPQAGFRVFGGKVWREFTLLQEFGPDSESAENFIWAAPEVTVAVNFYDLSAAATEPAARVRRA